MTQDSADPSTTGPIHNTNLRSNRAHYLLWLADDDADLLTVWVALSDEEIDWHLATEGSQ